MKVIDAVYQMFVQSAIEPPKAISDALEKREEFSKELPEDKQKAFDDLTGELYGLGEEWGFCEGFKMGVQMMAEVFAEE